MGWKITEMRSGLASSERTADTGTLPCAVGPRSSVRALRRRIRPLPCLRDRLGDLRRQLCEAVIALGVLGDLMHEILERGTPEDPGRLPGSQGRPLRRRKISPRTP